MGSGTNSGWGVLEGDHQVPEFTDAVLALYRGIFDRLPSSEQLCMM